MVAIHFYSLGAFPKELNLKPEISESSDEIDKFIQDYESEKPCVKQYFYDCPETWLPYVAGGFVLGLLGSQIVYGHTSN